MPNQDLHKNTLVKQPIQAHIHQLKSQLSCQKENLINQMNAIKFE